MTLYKWSQTASADATADSTINWAEGQSPSSVNDSARAMMAATAKYRDDIAGAIVTGGTSTAYTVSSYEVFDTLAHLNGQVIAFTPHATNGAAVTLNVDSLGAKPLRTSPGTELLAGTIIQGTPYAAVYNSSDAVFYLRSFYGNPYNIPLAGGLPFFGSTAPNSSFVFPFGQAISRSTYSALFTLLSTTYGTGDGSTTFNLPDLRGRVAAGKDDMGGSAASRLTTAGSAVDGATLGAVGGAQNVALITANLPPYTPAGSITNGAISISHNANSANSSSATGGGAFPVPATISASISASQAASTFTGTAQGGTSTAVKVAQPTIICNYIMRII
jgi:microcystin-dependent protein